MSDVYRNGMIFSANLTVRKGHVKSVKSELIQGTCSIYIKIQRKIKTNPLPLCSSCYFQMYLVLK